MKLEIVKLVIWPTKTNKSPRVIKFYPGRVNVIPGESKTGKSAIIKIIDYCLGSSTCNIPKFGPIRSYSSWFGILFDTEEGQKLFARRNPGQNDITDDYYILEAKKIDNIPNLIVKNANREDVRTILDKLGRLPQVNYDTSSNGKRIKGRASVSDMTAFLFQPQSLIASQDNMFFECNLEDHARRIREVFPLVLGVVDSEVLLKQHELQDVRRNLERKKRRLEVYLESFKDISGQIRGRYVRAVQLGFIERDHNYLHSIDEIDYNELLRELQMIVSEGRTFPIYKPKGHISIPIERLSSLRVRENQYNAELSEMRVRLSQITQVKMLRQSSESSLSQQMDRLKPVFSLTELLENEKECPLCGNLSSGAYQEIRRLKETTREVEGLLRNFQKIPPMLDAEENETRKRINSLESLLRQNTDEQRQILQEIEKSNGVLEDRAVFIGGLREFLNLINLNGNDQTNMIKEIQNLEEDERRLSLEVDPTMIANRKEKALFEFSLIAKHYGEIMELETSNELIHLDTSKLTVSVVKPSTGERSAWLREIGSGANWLGFHVATMLGLHEFFIREYIPYVPNFIVIDQPSQTHFPDDQDLDAEHEELKAVRRAFEAFDKAVTRTNGMLQIIVSEHAGDAVIQGLENTKVIEQWRKGRKLIPWNWDDEILLLLHQKKADYAFDDLLPKIHLDLVRSAYGNVDVQQYNTDTISAIFGKQGIYFETRVYKQNDDTSKTVIGIVDINLEVTITIVR